MQEAQAEATEAVTTEHLVCALRKALPWLEHPEVNALPLCGSPRGLADHIRTLLPPAEKAADQALDFPNGKRHNVRGNAHLTAAQEVEHEQE